MITPYENRAPGPPRYMHFYELDTDDPEAAFRQMSPTTVARIGAYGTRSRNEWQGHEALVIDYVNTFRRLGVEQRAACSQRSDLAGIRPGASMQDHRVPRQRVDRVR